jgi:cell division septation protein DedD
MKAIPRNLTTVLAAIVGIALAATVTWATSQLVRQHIALSSQPLTAGRQLLPSGARAQPPSGTATRPQVVKPTPRPSKPPSPPVSTATSAPPAPPGTAPSSAPSSAGATREATPPRSSALAGEGDSSSRRDD